MRFVAWVYMLTNRSQSVLYVGFTTDLPRRIWEHRTKRKQTAFTARYAINRLVYYQGFLSVTEAEKAEKFIKGKTRAWKRELITRHNPKWRDLTAEAEDEIR
jgi:putative endonuclease